MRLKICKHGDGCGYCLLHDEYCPDEPCPNEELIDYEPVKHGRWDDDHNCTVCGKKALCEEKPDPYHPCHLLTLFYADSTYCPNCGAKMDLEATDDEVS